MDIMELGAVGELVGGVAVVASLIYVGVQVRQNSDHLRQGNEIQKAAAAREFARDCNAIMLHMTDAKQLDAFRNALGGFSDLPKNQQASAHLLLSSASVLAQTNTYLDHRSLADSGIVEPFNNFVASMMRTPGGAEWWTEWGETYDPRFRQTIEGLVSNMESTGARTLFERAPWYEPEAGAGTHAST